jgi:hypothetical protein
MVEKQHIRVGVVYETSTSRAERLSDGAVGWVYRHALSHRRRHRTIGSILRNGLRRSHSEERRRQPCAGVHPDREYVAHCQRRGRSDTRQTIGTLSVPADPDSVSSFMNIRVADIQTCYELWRSRGAEFITEPKDKYGETRCYIRYPDGYIIEVGQSNPGFTYG